MKLRRGVILYLGLEIKKSICSFLGLLSHSHKPGMHVLTLSGPEGVLYQEGPCICVGKGVNF